LERNSADARIRAALAQDDPTAVELIWDRYAGDLLAFLTARLCCRHDAEDVLQTVFVKIARNRGQLAKASQPEAYVYRIAQNEAVTVLRRRRKEKRDIRPWLAPAKMEEKDRELAEQLAVALNQLPAAQREVVVLKTYREKTFREIARILGISLNTAASRYRYGMEKLQTLLKDVIP